MGFESRPPKRTHQGGHSGAGQRGRAHADALADVADDPPVEVSHRVRADPDFGQDVVHLGEGVSVRVILNLQKMLLSMHISRLV